MPGARPRRDPFTRLASSVTRRSPVPAGGLGVTRLARVADRSSGNGAVGIFGQLHFIDEWDVADDSDDTFRTTHEPISGSWNLSLNGLVAEEAEYTITGRTVTITDPTDLFLGADTQGSPWLMRIQYDYRVGPDPVPLGIRDTNSSSANGTAHDYPVPAGALAGDLVIMAFHTTSLLTSTPAGWELLEQVDFGTRHLWVLWGLAAGGGAEVFHATWDGTGASIKYMTAVAINGAEVVESAPTSALATATMTTAAVGAGGWTMHIATSNDGWTFDSLSADAAPGFGNPSTGIAHENPGTGAGTGITANSGTPDFASVTLKLGGVG